MNQIILTIFDKYLLFYVMQSCMETLKKCMFCKDKVTFLGYVVSVQGVEVCESKIEAIKNSLHP
jgi:hypothetical protein